MQCILKLKEDLAEWGTTNNSTRIWLDNLLKIPSDYGLDVPKEFIGLKRTPRNINTSVKCSREFICFGLKTALHKYLDKFDCGEDNLSSQFKLMESRFSSHLQCNCGLFSEV